LKYQLDKLEESTHTNKPKILVLVHDRETATFAKLNNRGYDILLDLSGEVAKKDQEVNIKKNFYSELLDKLADYNVRYSPSNIIVASSAFFKEDLMKQLKDEALKKKIILATCNNTGKNGINEVLKRPEVKQALKQDRASLELSMVDELLTEISKNEEASYGFKDVSAAVEAGAAAKLLVTDKLIFRSREEGSYDKLEKLMKTAESMQAEVHLINSENEAGKKLDGLGGIGSILRYKINY
jgi:mRNA surveillance protein pelota